MAGHFAGQCRTFFGVPSSLRRAVRLPALRAKLQPWQCISATEPARRGRRTASSAAPPVELLPYIHDPWGGHKSRTSHGQAGGGGRGSGTSSSSSNNSRRGSQQQRFLRQRQQLRHEMRQCRSAAELHGLLMERLAGVTAADVAYAWHLAATREFFTQGRPAHGLHMLLSQLAEEHVASMGPVALSTTAWACATSQLPCEQLLELLARQAEQRIYAFRPRELCALLWASALGGAPSGVRLLKTCSQLLERGMSLELFSSHDLSVLVWCCGKVQYSTPALLEAATLQCIAQAARFDPPSAARLVHGYAMLHHRPPGLLGPLCRGSLQIIEEFGPHDLSLLISSLGKLLCDPDPKFIFAASTQAAKLVPDARPEHLANLIWGFARLGQVPSAGRFMSKLCAHMGVHMEEYGGELVTSVMWGLAKLSYKPPASLLDKVVTYMTNEMTHHTPATLASLIWAFGIMASGSSRVAQEQGPQFRAFAQRAAGQLRDAGQQLSMQDMPSVLIALATLQVQPPEPLARRLAEGCAQMADQLPGDSLARMAWAAATLQLRDRRLISAIVNAPAACKLLPQGIAQLSWSLAALDCSPPELLSAWCRALCATSIPVHGADPITPLDKSRILWAYAQLGRCEQDMMARLLGGLKASDVPKMGPTGVAALLWACAKLQYNSGPAVSLAAQYVGAHVDAFSRMQLVQIVWALARLGYDDPAVLTAILSQVDKAQPQHTSSPEGMAPQPQHTSSPEGMASQPQHTSSPQGEAVQPQHASSPQGEATQPQHTSSPEGEAGVLA